MKREPLVPGDLVMLMPGGVSWQEFVGTIHVLRERVTPNVWMAFRGGVPSWFFEPPLVVVEGSTEYEIGWSEFRLKKIGNPGDDEADVHSDRVSRGEMLGI